MPSSVIIGSMLLRISATPPPTAVELTLRMVFPLSLEAIIFSSSMALPPAAGAYSSILGTVHLRAPALDDADYPLPQAFKRIGIRVKPGELFPDRLVVKVDLEPVG